MIHLENAAETEAFGGKLAPLVAAGDVIALYGDLGAGKTTLVRGLLSGLGFADDVPSPTFPIILPYAPPQTRLPIAHVDLYRLDRPEETGELGLDDYLDDGALCIEWPERLGAWLWPQTLCLHLELGTDGGRGLTAQVPAAWESRWSFT